MMMKEAFDMLAIFARALNAEVRMLMLQLHKTLMKQHLGYCILFGYAAAGKMPFSWKEYNRI